MSNKKDKESKLWITKKDFKFITDKFDYGSPVIMTYFIICFVTLLLNEVYHDAINEKLGLPGTLVPIPYPGIQLITHVIVHGDISHFTGNLSLILLVGPNVERKYGSFETLTMILTNALVTGILNGIFFKTALIGASGEVYMLICLHAITSVNKGKIPLPAFLCMLMYVGTEIINSFMSSSDNVSQFGHIIGAIIGIMFGIYCSRNGLIGDNAEHITFKNIIETRKQYKEFLQKSNNKTDSNNNNDDNNKE